jgi:hypothetical protein
MKYLWTLPLHMVSKYTPPCCLNKAVCARHDSASSDHRLLAKAMTKGEHVARGDPVDFRDHSEYLPPVSVLT